MKRILICSVGGSPDPIVHAIQQQRPDFVYFLCSTGDAPAASDRTVDQETSRVFPGKCPKCDAKFETVAKQKPIAGRSGLAPDQYRVESISAPDDLEQVLGMTFPPGEFDTVGGFILNLFGELPHEGDTVTYDSLQFKVLKMKGTRIMELEVQQI